MIDKNTQIITCPVCGHQYLPSEIFFPDDLVGKPTEIIKDNFGKIDFYLGEDQNLTEEYVCDGCGTRFTVQAAINFKTEVVEDKFDEEYVSKFNKPKKLILEESSLFD